MGKKFERRNPDKQWSLERTYQRKALIDKEIAIINRTMNSIDSQVKHLIKHVKESLRKKVTNKWIYKRQLEAQITEIKSKIYGDKTTVNQ